MYVGTGSILVLFTEHQLTRNRPIFNYAVNVINVFKYTDNQLNPVFKYTKIKVFIDIFVNTQEY